MRLKGNNKGYTLVELLMTLAIFGIVMIGIALIMRTTSVSYVNSSSEIAMQTEAQIIANQIEEILVDATDAFSASTDASGYKVYTVVNVNRGEQHWIKYDHNEDKIYYDKVANGNGASNYSLMAEYVSDFDITGWNTEENNVNRDNKVTVEIEMDKDGYVYEVSRDVYFRNAIENPTAYVLPSTANNSEEGGGAKPYSQVVDIDRYEVIDLKKECGFLAVDSTSSASDDVTFSSLYTYTTATPNSGTYEIAKAITSSTPTNDKKLYITTNATTNATTGFSLYADETTGIMIKGITAYNPDGSAAAYKTVLLTTSPVSFDLSTSTEAADGAVYLSTATGDGGGGYMWVGVKGINIASMVYTNSKPYQYAMVAYDCGGTIGYTKDTGNLPQVKKVSTVSHGYSDGVSFALNSCGIQKGLAFKPDPEENGFLIVQDNNALSATTDALDAMSDGDYRLAIMIHFPGQSLSASHTVIDLALVPHGLDMTNYQGAASYTASPSDWGVTFTN